jgi:hypothetical protein
VTKDKFVVHQQLSQCMFPCARVLACRNFSILGGLVAWPGAVPGSTTVLITTAEHDEIHERQHRHVFNRKQGVTRDNA